MTNLTNRSSFDVFLEDRYIPNPDELLGRAINYLQSQGNTILLKGFTTKNDPLLDINGELFMFEKTFGVWEGAHFTKITSDIVAVDNGDNTRLINIQSFI